jgi:hypothetical protein
MVNEVLGDKTATTALSSGDIAYVVNDPTGTPLDKKITVDNFFAKPLPIGSGTANTGAFTTLGATGLITSGAGVTFDGGTNTLDEYEEGSWTPSIGLVTVTVTSATGRHTRIGNMMFIDFSITYNSLDTSDSSSISITSLPVALANANFVSGNIDTIASTGLNFGAVNCHFTSDGSTSSIRLADGDGGVIRYNNSIISAAGVIQGMASYKV